MRRVPGLDLLRAIAILWVMWSHSFLLNLGADTDPVAQFGWMGVDLFFVLSGYLIGSQLLKPVAAGRGIDLKDFWFRRAFRILPAYMVVVAFYFSIPALREWPEIQPFWQFPTFTENLLIDFRHPKAFSHVWSLCVEEHFYLLAPLVILALTRRPSAPKTIAVCGLIVAGGMALRSLIWLYDLPAAPQDSAAFAHAAMQRIYYPTWTRLDGLLAGVALAMTKTFRPALWSALMARANLLAGTGVVGLAASIALFKDQFAFWPSVVGYPLLAMSFALLTASAASPKGLLGARPIPGAGLVAAMAYSLYLSHKAIYHLVARGLGPVGKPHPELTIALAAAGAFAVGGLLYVAVERPFLRWRDRLERARAPAPVAAA